MIRDERPRQRSLAVYEAPPVPEGWHGRDVIRIIDPLGVQAAWVAPNPRGALVAWFVRRTPGEAWVQVLGGTHGQPGGELLGRDPAGDRFVPADAAGWGFIERDPTALTVRGSLDGRPVALSLRCDEGLHIDARVEGAGSHPGYRLRLHPGLGPPAGTAAGDRGIRFVSGPVAGMDWLIGAGLRVVPALAREAPWQIDIVPEEHAGHDHREFGFVLTASCRNG